MILFKNILMFLIFIIDVIGSPYSIGGLDRYYPLMPAAKSVLGVYARAFIAF